MIPINRKSMEKFTDISLLLNNKLDKLNMIRHPKATLNALLEIVGTISTNNHIEKLENYI